MRFALLSAMGVWLLSVAGCSGKDVAGCTQDGQCPAGHVCLGRTCEKLCNDDRDCSAGRFCNGEICVVGTRDDPVLLGIEGSGSDTCVFDTGRSCIGTHFVVTGRNLGGSEFLLQDPDDDSRRHIMVVPPGGRVQDDLVDLAPEGGVDILPGNYVLVVSNSAGQDQTGVTLLQGEPGDDASFTGDEIITRINLSTAQIDADRIVGGGGGMTGEQIITTINTANSGIIDSERVAGGSGGGGATLYVFDNTTTATETGHSGDRMVVRVDASTTNVASLAIDQARLLTLCGDPDGCQISLGTIGWRMSGEPLWEVAAPYVNTPCRFFIDEGAGTGNGDAWSISSSCTQRFVVCGQGYNYPCIEERLYIAHYSGQFGSDGEAGTGTPPNETWNVLHNRACFFSETAPDTSLGCACDVTLGSCDGACNCDPDCDCACDTTGGCDAGTGPNGECICDPFCIYTRLEDDSSKGFTLFASHPSWAGPYWVGDDFWPSDDPDRACILIVED